MKESIATFYQLHKPLLGALLVWSLAFASLFFFDWSGATGWFVFGIVAIVGSTALLGISIYKTIANRYVYNNYVDGIRKERTPSYRAQLRRLRRQRAKAVNKIFEYRNDSYYRNDYDTQLKSIDRKIAEHMGYKKP